MVNRLEQLIDGIFEYLDGCKPIKLQPGKVAVNKEELFEMLDELKQRTPDEIRRYQKIIANRDSIIASAEEKAEQIIEESKAKARQLVSEHEIMQQAYARANEMVASASGEAEEMLSSANNDATQIRTGALSYANDIMTDMEKILNNAYSSARDHFDGLIATLKENYDVVASNRQELYQQLNPKDAATIYDDPIATVTEEEEDDGENFEFDENTFLENIDE
ncbi:MAG: ATPase [Lachnospiraceae bacterium]|nr:ATPase [Lachnospiraceae bacterium]